MSKDSTMAIEGGLRVRGNNKISRPYKPLVTIITSTLNACEYLASTFKSIDELSYENIEWIIIDGGSTDRTLELIRQNEHLVDYWKSELDAGIYDAWNKGLAVAHGEWIAFLGAGDRYNPDAIVWYLNAISQSSVIPELVSSRVRLVTASGSSLRIVGSPFNWESFKKRMTIAHVGALHNRSLFEKYGYFDTSYSIAADYEFLMRCGANLTTLYLDDITVGALVGGRSFGCAALNETYLIQKKYGAGKSANLRLWLARAKLGIRPFLRGY